MVQVVLVTLIVILIGYIIHLEGVIKKFNDVMDDNTQLLFVDANAVDVDKIKPQIGHLLIEVIPVQLPAGGDIKNHVVLAV